MSWAAVLSALKTVGTIATAAGAVKSLFAEPEGGGGGGVSPTTETGRNQIAYEPVGMETGQITPFEYLMQQEEFEKEEEAQRAAYGGPLYRDKGGGISDLFNRLFLPQEESDEMLEHMDPSKVEEELSERKAKFEEKTEKTNAWLDSFTDDVKTLEKIKETFFPDQQANIKGRGNIVPMGGRQARQDRQKETSLGITPFEYQFAAHGKPLNRSMFAQNYMPDGGDIRGPGGPRDDLIPVMASNGEYMLSKAAVDQAGGGNHARGIAALEEFNNRGNRRYG